MRAIVLGSDGGRLVPDDPDPRPAAGEVEVETLIDGSYPLEQAPAMLERAAREPVFKLQLEIDRQ